MTATILIIVCAVLILLALPVTHSKAYLSGMEAGRTEIVVLLRQVSPEAAQMFAKKLEEINLL